jgi:hypothetical protein
MKKLPESRILIVSKFSSIPESSKTTSTVPLVREELPWASNAQENMVKRINSAENKYFMLILHNMHKVLTSKSSVS